MNELPEAIIDAAAATLAACVEEPWDDLGRGQKESFRHEAEAALRAALSVTSTEGPQLILGEAWLWGSAVRDVEGRPAMVTRSRYRDDDEVFYRSISPLPIEGDAKHG